MCQFTYTSSLWVIFIFCCSDIHFICSLTWQGSQKFLCICRCSLWKLQGVWVVSMQGHLLFLARTDSGVAQMVTGASFGNCWCSSSDMNYASKRSFGISSLCNTIAATIGMTLKDMIPWSNLSTSSLFCDVCKECTLKTTLSKWKWAAESSSFQKHEKAVVLPALVILRTFLKLVTHQCISFWASSYFLELPPK